MSGAVDDFALFFFLDESDDEVEAEDDKVPIMVTVGCYSLVVIRGVIVAAGLICGVLRAMTTVATYALIPQGA